MTTFQPEAEFSIGGRRLTSGRVLGGDLEVGEKVQVQGRGKYLVKAMEQFRKRRTHAMAGEQVALELEKTAGVPLLEQNRSEKFKEIYRALKRDHPEMPVEVKARIAARKSKQNKTSRKSPKDGGPKYKAPLHHKRVGKGKDATYVGKTKKQREKDEMYKEAFGNPIVDALGPLGVGTVGGFQAGKPLARETAGIIAPYGRKGRAEQLADKGSILPVIAASLLGAMVLGKNKRLRAKALELLGKAGLEPQDAMTAVTYGLPIASGVAGGSAAGVGTGLLVGGVARLKGEKRGGHAVEKTASALYKRAAANCKAKFVERLRRAVGDESDPAPVHDLTKKAMTLVELATLLGAGTVGGFSGREQAGEGRRGAGFAVGAPAGMAGGIGGLLGGAAIEKALTKKPGLWGALAGAVIGSRLAGAGAGHLVRKRESPRQENA